MHIIESKIGPAPADAAPGAVLVVASEPSSRERVTGLLGGRPGAEVLTTGCTHQAMRMLREGQAGAMVVVRPGAHPWADVLDRTGTLTTERSWPVVAVTGPGAGDRAAAIRAGAHEVLDEAELSTATLDRALSLARERWRLTAGRLERSALHLALDLARTGVWDWELATGALAWSQACFDILGVRPADFTGRVDDFFALIHPEDRADDGTTRKLIAERSHYVSEFRVIRPVDGRTIWVQNMGRACVDATGATTHLMGTLVDITRAVDDRRQREEALARSERAVNSRDDLLRVVSHDLRNPLNVLGLGVRLIADEPDRGDRARLLTQMTTQVRRMERLIDELTEASRLGAGQPLDLRLAPADLAQLTRTVAAEHQAKSPRHHLDVSEVPATCPGVWDVRRLERALGNLVSNAITYSPAGGTIVIRLATDADGDAWWSIRDPGIGISAADRTRIFEWFARGENARPLASGTGVGLAAARRIITEHGGAVEVKSELGQGSTFTVRLPCRRADRPGTPAADRRPRGVELEARALGGGAP